MLNIIRIFICRNIIGIVFGYFQKLNIIHIFIQSFFKSWILSFFVFSPENTIRSSLKTIALGFYHLYTSPDFEPVYQLLWTKETNKKVWNSPKPTKLSKMVQWPEGTRLGAAGSLPHAAVRRRSWLLITNISKT